MLLASISMVFALIFGTIAYRSIPYGWTLTRIGWGVLRSNTDKSDATQNVETRSMLSDGNRFFLAGLGWFISGIFAAIVALFAMLAIPMILGWV